MLLTSLFMFLQKKMEKELPAVMANPSALSSDLNIYYNRTTYKPNYEEMHIKEYKMGHMQQQGILKKEIKEIDIAVIDSFFDNLLIL